jgi:phage shock protein E
MKYLILLISILIISTACAKTGKIKPEIMTDNNTVLIDVRTKDEFKSGHLEKAINIPYTEIEGKINSITKDTNQHIVLYCRSGRRSGIAQKTLLKMGYKNAVNGGSYKSLQINETEQKK